MVNYSHIIREAPMRMVNPSVTVFPSGECRNRALDWILWFWNLRWLEMCFVDSPRVSGIFGKL